MPSRVRAVRGEPSRGRAFLHTATAAVGLALGLAAAAFATWRLGYVPGVVEREYLEGYHAYVEGDFPRARAHLTRLVSLDPGHADAQTLLGWTHWRLGELIQAEPHFRAAHERDPASVEARAALATVLLALSRTEDALPILEETARLLPHDVETRLRLAEAYRRSGRNRVAVALYREMLAKDPTEFRAEQGLLEMFGYPALSPDALLEHAPVVRPAQLEVRFRTEGDYLQAWDEGRWRSVYLTGANLGPARPGEWSVAASLSFDIYHDWLRQIAESGANTVRVYTILPPAFYRALEAHNLAAPEPLWLIQEAWLAENALDLYEPRTRRDFERELRSAIDVIHGQADIGCRTGHYCGMYTADVSRWVIGISVGREVEPRTVRATNRLNPERTSYSGTYVSLPRGTPSEAWFAEMCDIAARYETETYNAQRPVTVVTWPPLDPLTHVSEATYEEELAIRRAKGEVVPDAVPADMNDMDAVSIHVPNFSAELPFRAGLFALYHVYQHWPDFMFLEESFATAQDDQGPNRYLGYLIRLKEQHSGFPLLIGEYGVSTSQSPAHLHPDGWHNGGLSEREQAELLTRFTNNIRDAGMAGGVVFEWADEWWKQVHDEFTAQLEPRASDPLWMNTLDPEERFGIVGYRPFDRVPLLRASEADWSSADTLYRAPVDSVSDGEAAPSGSAWMRGVYATADYSYLYLRLDLDPRVELDREASRIRIALSTLPGRSGSTVLPEMALRIPSGANFLVEVDGLSRARLLVARNHSPWLTLAPAGRPDLARIDRKAGMKVALGESAFEELVVEVNQPRWTRDGREFRALTFGHGALPFGSADPDGEGYNSRALWSVDPRSGMMELRIPWLMLLVTDPAGRRVFAGTDDGRKAQSAATEGIAVSVFAWNAGNAQEDGEEGSALIAAFPPVTAGVAGVPRVYAWNTWERVRYREYLKESYYALRAIWRTWPRFLDE